MEENKQNMRCPSTYNMERWIFLKTFVFWPFGLTLVSRFLRMSLTVTFFIIYLEFRLCGGKFNNRRALGRVFFSFVYYEFFYSPRRLSPYLYLYPQREISECRRILLTINIFLRPLCFTLIFFEKTSISKLFLYVPTQRLRFPEAVNTYSHKRPINI